MEWFGNPSITVTVFDVKVYIYIGSGLIYIYIAGFSLVYKRRQKFRLVTRRLVVGRLLICITLTGGCDATVWRVCRTNGVVGSEHLKGCMLAGLCRTLGSVCGLSLHHF